jgi:hypothetical protein
LPLAGCLRIAANVCIGATHKKALIMNYLTIQEGDTTVTYGNKPYSVQNDRGHFHIVVYEKGKRKKITVKKTERDCVFDYIFGGGFINYPCPAMDYWIERHRMGRKISTKDFAVKHNIQIKN